MARALTLMLDQVTVVHLERKGRGRALRAAWTASDADVLCYMDVDLSTDLRALLPLITFVGIEIGRLMAGAFIVEQIFTWPGMGSLALSAINSRDYPVIQAFAILVAAIVLLGNLAADLAYGIADPRIRLE